MTTRKTSDGFQVRSVIAPLLASLYPVLYLYSLNMAWVNLEELFIALLGSVFVAFIVLAVCNILLHERLNASIISTLVTLEILSGARLRFFVSLSRFHTQHFFLRYQ
jgi:FlaA1/EpsC-like NDP-sugar epimerase